MSSNSILCHPKKLYKSRKKLHFFDQEWLKFLLSKFIIDIIDIAIDGKILTYLPTYLPTYPPTYLPTYLPT